jgi:hypothetical protein
MNSIELRDPRTGTPANRPTRTELAIAIDALLSSPEDSPVNFGYGNKNLAKLPSNYEDGGEGYEDVFVNVWYAEPADESREPDAIVRAGDYLDSWADPRETAERKPFVITFNGEDEQYGRTDFDLWGIDMSHDVHSWWSERINFTKVRLSVRRHSGHVEKRDMYLTYEIGENVRVRALEYEYKNGIINSIASIDDIETLTDAIQELTSEGETDLEPWKTRLDTLKKMEQER